MSRLTQPQHAVSERAPHVLDKNGGSVIGAGFGRIVELVQHIAHQPRVELDDDAEKRHLVAGARHIADQRHFDIDHQRLHLVVVQRFVAEHHLLCSLCDDAQRRFVENVVRDRVGARARQRHLFDVRREEAIAVADGINPTGNCILQSR